MTTLKGTVDAIRNILRGEGITGMESINHCLVFLISRCLDVTLCEKLKIPTKYAFENLFKNDEGEELDNQQLYGKFYTKGSKNCLMYHVSENIGFKNATFKLVGPDNLQKILKALSKIDISKLSETTDLVGIVYELHLKSGTSNAMRDLGQYFTHRLVIKYMIELCAPKVVNGKVEKIADPSMGTGGFLTMAIKYLNQHNKKIDWSKNKDRIYGFDIDETVKNMASLNLLLETGELFNTMIKRDTLYEDIKINDISLDDIDVLLANEPMGLKNIIHANCCNKIKDLKIRGTKAEPLFLQLFMKSLADNGRCAVVVPDGVMFNESELHKETRKYLVENFNLKKIAILKDKDFFLNTGVSTSILYFVKDGNRTQEVEFVELRMNKEQTEVVETVVTKVKYDEIKKNKYSLFVNKYAVVDDKKIEGIEYKKIDDICEIKSGVKFALPDEMFSENKTEYAYIKIKDLKNMSINMESLTYLSNQGAEKTKNNRFNIGDLYFSIVGTVGSCGIIPHNLINASYSGNIIKITNVKDINSKFLCYYLNSDKFKQDLNKIITTSVQPKVIIDDIKNLEIPIPSLEIQKQIVEQLDIISENNKTCEKGIDEFTKIMKYYVKVHTADGEEKKLGEISSVKYGGSKYSNDEGEYPLYGGGVSYIKLIKDFNVESNTITIPRSGNSAGHVNITFKKSYIANFGYYLDDLKNVDPKYLYYKLKSIQDHIQTLPKGTGQPNLNRVDLENVDIKIISLEKQAEIVKYCDNLSNMIQNLQNQINENNILMKHIIDYYLKQKNDEQLDEPVNENKNDDDDEPPADKQEIKQSILSSIDNSETKSEDKKSPEPKPKKKTLVKAVKSKPEPENESNDEVKPLVQKQNKPKTVSDSTITESDESIPKIVQSLESANVSKVVAVNKMKAAKPVITVVSKDA